MPRENNQFVEAVEFLKGSPARFVKEGKSSYWAKTAVVEVQETGEMLFVKQIGNMIKATLSGSEPRIYDLLEEKQIPCAHTLAYLGNGNFWKGTPTVIYEYINTLAIDGEGPDIKENCIDIEKDLAALLAKIHAIEPKDGIETNFQRGIEDDHIQELIDDIDHTDFLDAKQKKTVLQLMEQLSGDTCLTHQDLYPANILFYGNSNSGYKLHKIVDWERALFTNFGADFMAVFATISELNLDFNSLLNYYVEFSGKSKKEVINGLKTYGLQKAIRLHEKVKSILEKDETASSDEKVMKMKNWAEQYKNFVFSLKI